MRPRQGIIEVFSTFLQFDVDRFSAWATEPQLRRSMQISLKRLPQIETAENFWVLYWYKLWQTQPTGLAKLHLAAYLQEVCYWAAHKTSASFSTAQYTLSDYFQMAIARLEKVLKGFNPQLGYNFKNYASAVFHSVLKDILRQHQEVDICTNWSLLRKLSQKRLVESLQNAGLSAEVAGYVLAWNCFKTIYVPTQPTGTRQLPKPDASMWQAITALYNTERHSQLYPVGPECSAQMIERWLIACAKAARSYLYPSFVSINAPRPGQESGEFLDNLADEFAQETHLNEIIAAEEQQSQHLQQDQLKVVIAEALAGLELQAQSIMQLYYGRSLTQQQIAQELDIKQYTISRRLTKSRETILISLARWSQETLHITLTSEVLNYISTVLEEWLKAYYSRPQSQMESSP